MRKTIVFMLALVLLAGCSLRATPTPTAAPRPTPTPTEEVRYYPKPDAGLRQELLYRVPKPNPYYKEVTAPDGTKYETFGLMVVSSGKTETFKAGNYDLDVVWVYERNLDAAYYPLVVGVWDGETYTPYYTRYEGEYSRDAFLNYLHSQGILDRGRILYPTIGSKKNGYVSLHKQIEWDRCGDSTYCRLGKYMQETYQMDRKVIGQYAGLDPIPEGWALAWMWDAATEENTDPAFIKVDLPGGE